jgi:hypothetical protein
VVNSRSRYTEKPCHHALSLIIAQHIRDVMEDFVNEYYFVEMFRKAYTRSSLFVARKSGPKWTCHFKSVHHLKKGVSEGKEKIESKVASKVGEVGQNLVQRLLKIKMRGPKKWSEAKCNVPTVESWDTGKRVTNVHLMELRKGKICSFVASHVYFIHVLFT